MKILKNIKARLDGKPHIKKIVGVTLVIIGFAALVTPLTPGSWLGIIGLELLGVRLLFFEKFKFWNQKEKKAPSDLPESK